MPNWLLLLPTWVLLCAIAFGGAMATMAVTLYPAASAREEKARLAQGARAILSSELQVNNKLSDKMQNMLERGLVPEFKLNVSAWQTISNGGLLIGLDATQITKFLRVYSIVFEVNELCTRVLDLSIGVSAALGNSQQIRTSFMKELQGKLSELQKALADVE